MYARKYTAALLRQISAPSFAASCNRPIEAGGNEWACIIDHLESPDDQTIVYYLTPAADFDRWTGAFPTIFDATAIPGDVPNLNTCIYHAVAIASDGRRKDWYDQYCAKDHDTLLP